MTTTRMDMDDMLARIQDRQWALADIDWDAPGADQIRPEQYEGLKTFMADLVWIEQVGGRGFAAMAKKAPTPTLGKIYEYFYAEEQRHANAELALMHRWGMLEDGEIPEPNVNIRIIIEWLDKYSDAMPLSVLGTVIPMLEVALDGALLKFLLDEVTDPVCHEVFKHINSDESRHIAVDFEVLDMLGSARARKLAIDLVGTWVRPTLLLGVVAYLPLLSRMRDNIIAMGMREDLLYEAIGKFGRLGDRGAFTRRNPMYQIIKAHGKMVIDRSHPYHRLGDALVATSAHFPTRVLGPVPTWIKELTHEPVAA